MTNCMSLQLLPFKLNSILISHNYDNAKDTYFESAVFLRTRRSSTAKVVFLELRALEGEGRVESDWEARRVLELGLWSQEPGARDWHH